MKQYKFILYLLHKRVEKLAWKDRTKARNIPSLFVSLQNLFDFFRILIFFLKVNIFILKALNFRFFLIFSFFFSVSVLHYKNCKVCIVFWGLRHKSMGLFFYMVHVVMVLIGLMTNIICIFGVRPCFLGFKNLDHIFEGLKFIF